MDPFDPASSSGRVVLQKEPPRSDIQVDVRRAGNFILVILAGKISESFKGEELGRRLVGNVILDTRQVDKVTSFGVRAWLAMLNAMDVDHLYFARCSEAVLSQMAMIRSFVGSGVITSFFAPYLCERCGNAFQVLYDAVEDAALIEAQQPVEVPCPRCKSRCTLDDDPASFFRIGPLLQNSNERLKQALARLPPLGSDADPIEKSIRGALTVIKFNSRLDESVRLRRVFDGLEGAVRLDLGAIPEVTEKGMQIFLRALQNLDPEVSVATLIGCPESIAVALANRPLDPRIRVESLIVRARCAETGEQRDVYLDLEEHGDAILRDEPPMLRCDWCDHPLDVARLRPTLLTLVRRLRGDPTPTPSTTAPSPPASTRRRAPWIVAGLLAVLLFAAVAVGALGVAGAVAYTLAANDRPDPDAWIAGKTPPPAWTEVVWTEDPSGIAVVAGADADDLEAAYAQAKDKALLILLDHLRDALRDRPIHPLIPPAPTNPDAAWRARVIEEYLEMGPWAVPTRDKVAVRKGGPKTRIFVRYHLPAEAWKRVVAHYGDTFSFRGIDLARRFPFQDPLPESDVVVVGKRSWLAEPQVGDRLLKVGDDPALELSHARQLLESRWAALPYGQQLLLVFHDGDGPKQVSLLKKQAL